SPDGRTVLFTDLGPGDDGVDATQVVTLDVESGRRTQVTRLGPASSSDDFFPPVRAPRYLDSERIAYIELSHDALEVVIVSADGDGELSRLSAPILVPGSTLDPTFLVTGPATTVLPLLLPGPSMNPSLVNPSS